MTHSAWLLPDDGIVDPIAIEVAATGKRRVRLTPTERRLAAASILARGGTAADISRRLHITGTRARTLTEQATTDATIVKESHERFASAARRRHRRTRDRPRPAA